MKFGHSRIIYGKVRTVRDFYVGQGPGRKLQKLMAQPQSGGENVKKQKKVCKPVKHCVVAP